MKVICYARVSTSQQESTAAQLAACREYAEKNYPDSEIVLIEDKGYSGTSDRRPGLEKMMALVEAEEASAIVIYKLDRLFRSLVHMANTVEQLNDYGCTLSSVTENFDLGTSGGKMMLGLLSVLGSWERDVISERTKAALAYKRDVEGVQLGRPRTIDDSTYIQILTLRTQHKLSLREISKLTGVSLASVHRIISQDQEAV